MSKWDCNKLLEEFLQEIKKKGSKNCEYMLSLENLPHMEPTLRQIHLETYLVTLLGFPNISLIMQGILLEALLKEIIFEKERTDFHGSYGSALEHSNMKGYLDKKDYRFLDEFRDKIRNRYQHIDVKELTEGSYAYVYKVKIDKDDPAGSILKGTLEVLSGKSKPPIKMTPEQMRPLGQIMKLQIDENIYVEQFLYVDYFVRKMCRKYFPVE